MNFTWLMRPGTASAFTPKPLTPFKYRLRLGEGGGRRVGGPWANVPPPLKNPVYASDCIEYRTVCFSIFSENSNTGFNLLWLYRW